MSSEADQARLIAERIAQRVSHEQPASRPMQSGASDVGAELAAMRASLGQLQDRLIQIEARVRAGSNPTSYSSPVTPGAPGVPLTHSPWLAGVNATPIHASQERFGVEEATVSELVDYFQNEKTCSLEPGGKPCDHCAMCSSRGF